MTPRKITEIASLITTCIYQSLIINVQTLNFRSHLSVVFFTTMIYVLFNKRAGMFYQV